MSGGQSMRDAKAAAQARENEEKRVEERKRGIMVLILSHLFTHGYLDTVEKLQAESGVSLEKYDAADNMDLTSVVQDYEAYYEIRFKKKPKLFRKLAVAEGGPSSGPARPLKRAGSANVGVIPPVRTNSMNATSDPRAAILDAKASAWNDAMTRTSGGSSARPQSSRVISGSASGGGGGSRGSPAVGSDGGPDDDDQGGPMLGLKGSAVGNRGAPPPVPRPEPSTLPSINPRGNSGGGGGGATNSGYGGGGDWEDPEVRLLRPLPDFGGNMEMRELAAMITRDIFTKNPNVAFKNIAGLDSAKRILKEAVVMPVKYPQLFTGILTPWKGLLLFGPPGTGKTMLAKAVATECNTTFFNISASSIVSKWRGDSEKLVRVLFELARYHAPSTIFLDEIDAIMGQRGAGGASNEHEGSRRMKTELLIQMDGLSKTDDLVFVLCASNLPWDLDSAMLRRLEKRILVPLPNAEARRAMFENNLPHSRAPGLDYGALATLTNGYSGSDIHLVSKEAAMRPLRRLMDQIENESEETLANHELVMGPVMMEDVSAALATTKPSAAGDAERFNKWQADFGST